MWEEKGIQHIKHLLATHKLPDFEGQAGAQEGFADPGVCPVHEPSAVSGDEANSWAVPMFQRLGVGACRAGPAPPGAEAGVRLRSGRTRSYA